METEPHVFAVKGGKLVGTYMDGKMQDKKPVGRAEYLAFLLALTALTLADWVRVAIPMPGSRNIS